MSETRAVLHVCVTCRAGVEPGADHPLPGARLYERLQTLLADHPNPPVSLFPAKCLAHCERGCSAAIAMPGKWSTLLGGLGPGHAADLLGYAAIYAASATGVVMPSKRPASLAATVHGRIPAPPPVPALPTSQTETQPA